MRAREFLFEYKRDITAQRLGDKLIDAIGNTPAWAMSDHLHGAHTLVHMVKHPQSFTDRTIIIPVMGHQIHLNPKNAPENLNQLKDEIIDELLDEIESKDPTPNKTYTQFLVRSFINNPRFKIEDMNFNNIIGVYDLMKRRNLLKTEHRDINRFKSYEEFQNTINREYDLEKIIDTVPDSEIRGEYEEVYKDDKVRVIHPLDEKAACYYGRSTRWCTAATQSENYFEKYNRKGPLYILLPTKPQYAGEKYQIHVQQNEFANELNEQQPLWHFKKKFPEFMKWLVEREPDLKSAVEFTDDAELKQLLDIFREPVEEYVTDLINEYELNDAGWEEYRREAAESLGYVERDEDGDITDIDWDKVYEDPDLNDYLAYNDEARMLARDIERVFRSTGSDIKFFAAELDQDENDLYKVEQFETLVGKLIANELDSSMGNKYLEWLDRHFAVYNKSTPLKYGGEFWRKIGETEHYIVYQRKHKV